MRWFRPRAKPPEDVRLVLADDTEIPVECVYAGWDDGAHQWDAIAPPGVIPVSARIGMLPGRTAVRVTVSATALRWEVGDAP